MLKMSMFAMENSASKYNAIKSIAWMALFQNGKNTWYFAYYRAHNSDP